MMSGRAGSLAVVGTGYRLAGQTTAEALDCITSCEKLLHLVEPVTERWLQSLNSTAESLSNSYAVSKDRLKTYEEMVERTLAYVRKDLSVCVAVYGHPGVFATFPHTVISRARKEGFRAKMYPGISAADCLFADLG